MLQLPDFPWNALIPAKDRASQHPDGLVDLSVGSPVDPTPDVIARILSQSTDAHAYPTTNGTAALRDAIVSWYSRRRNATGLVPAGAIPTVGSKELVGLMPTLLGLRPGDVVVHPTVAYPTYDIGARVVGATPFPSDEPDEWPAATKLVWLNSPANPSGRLDSVEFLRRAVARARNLGAVIINDECYAQLVWTDSEAPSILDDRVVGSDLTGVLSAYSLSKQSNLAGYRAAFLAGDPQLIAGILEVRKHLGLIVPAPVQAAMVAALNDDGHVEAQKGLYRSRREVLLPALISAGFTVDYSEAGLYLWVTRDEPSFDTIDWLAGLGILAAPGIFYGEAGARHVRIALTATDERIAAAVRRLADAATTSVQ